VQVHDGVRTVLEIAVVEQEQEGEVFWSDGDDWDDDEL
jgi:hypothetical protein